MNDTTQAQEMLTRSTDKAVETLTLWAETNQRVLRELAELSTAGAKEGVRLLGELQQAGIDTLRDTPGAGLRWQARWQEAPRDPLAWYQRAVMDGVEHTQTWLRVLEGNTQAVTRSAERLQSTAEQAGRSIQATLSEAMTKMKDACGA